MPDLFPYQQKGVDFLCATKPNPNRLLAWEAGSGKTPVAVVSADRLELDSILVICPPIAIGVWAEHFVTWSAKDRTIHVLDDMRQGVREDSEIVTVVGYSRVGRLQRHLKFRFWDLLILDETHFLKNPNAQRTRAVYGDEIGSRDGITGMASTIWCLTGTPVLNHALDLYPHLRALAPETLIY